MRKLDALLSVLLTGFVLNSATAWPQQAAANGYYDAKNDWLVFEWMNPQTGHKVSIYDSSNKIQPVIRAVVVADDTSGNYTFRYQVSNLRGAVQLLQIVFVPHLSAIFDSASPTVDWRGSEYRNQGVWGWYKVGTVHGIPAGESASGFSFKSKGLPTIVTASFAGARRAEYTIPSPDDDPEEVQTSFEQVFKSLKAKYPNRFIDRVQLKTIGPVNPPKSFDAMAFLQNLISLKEQSLTLRWIDNRGVAISLDAKLNVAKMKIVGGDNKTAKKALGAFLNEVQAQNGKHLKHEAYALLYYNGRYLLNHL